MSALRKAPRRLERYRATVKVKKIAEKEGAGKKAARAASDEALRKSLTHRKATGKAMRELEALNLAELNSKLAEARQELFTLRFQHATAALVNVASIPAAKRRIARILTLIKQKEGGA